YNGMQGFIDPRQLSWGLQESFEQAGSWADQQFNNAVIDTQDPLAASLAMEEFPGYQDMSQPEVGWFDASNETRQLLPSGAKALVPEAARRPQLQLQTKDIGLQPSIHDQPLPRSAPAPDIRVHEPDSLPMQFPTSALPIYDNARRRARTNPHTQPPSLYHAVTAPEMPITPTSGLLSPLVRRFDQPLSNPEPPWPCIALEKSI
ncbi:hypothetical protein B0A55_03423, partial [Friedmanniomyces simplex]